MKELLKRLSLLPKGLRYKLMIAFSLMSIIPLLICVYLASIYIFPNIRDFDLMNISIIIIIGIFIAFLGLVLAKNFIDPIVKMAVETRDIANGNVDHMINIQREDEIGELGDAINRITYRIKENMNELKSYGEKTKEINTQIHQKVLVLSSILQIGNLISEVVEIDKILDFIVEKICQFDDIESSFLILLDEAKKEYFIKSGYNTLQANLIKGLEINKDFLEEIISKRKTFAIDANTKLSNNIKAFCDSFDVANAAIFIINSANRPMGALIAANKKDNYSFSNEDLDTIGIFARQLSIAIENDILLKKVDTLAVRDDLTNLFNQSYIINRLDEEIKRSVIYQRPCAFILFDIDDFKIFRDKFGEVTAEGVLKKIAKTLEQKISEVDRLARFGDDEFAVVLPEKNKRQALEIAQKMKEAVGSLKHVVGADSIAITVSGAVSENPIDGMSAKELIEKATGCVMRAKSQGKNKVVV